MLHCIGLCYTVHGLCRCQVHHQGKRARVCVFACVCVHDPMLLILLLYLILKYCACAVHFCYWDHIKQYSFFVCILQLLEAMGGKSGVVECAFVQSDVTEVNYFATPILLGKNGVEKNLGLGNLSAFEQEKLKEVSFEHQHNRCNGTYTIATCTCVHVCQYKRSMLLLQQYTCHITGTFCSA